MSISMVIKVGDEDEKSPTPMVIQQKKGHSTNESIKYSIMIIHWSGVNLVRSWKSLTQRENFSYCIHIMNSSLILLCNSSINDDTKYSRAIKRNTKCPPKYLEESYLVYQFLTNYYINGNIDTRNPLIQYNQLL